LEDRLGILVWEKKLIFFMQESDKSGADFKKRNRFERNDRITASWGITVGRPYQEPKPRVTLLTRVSLQQAACEGRLLFICQARWGIKDRVPVDGWLNNCDIRGHKSHFFQGGLRPRGGNEGGNLDGPKRGASS